MDLEKRDARLKAKHDGIKQTNEDLLDAVREMEITRAKPNERAFYLSDAIPLHLYSNQMPQQGPRPHQALHQLEGQPGNGNKSYTKLPRKPQNK